ncbi:MotA/TolQ/ExbB proton channel family protein [Methylocystis parvus]|uniref:MotA/TolQ/ExbB proton channel family protein n=1 Tax=Methylocystis parvus TaxID=134 RepID=UPI003C781B3F
MFDTFVLVGISTRNAVLWLASLLKFEPAPGLVTLAILCLLGFAILTFGRLAFARREAVLWLRRLIAETANQAAFAAAIAGLDYKIELEAKSGARQQVATAWREYRETLVAHEENGTTTLRNSVRPAVFFKLEDLHFGVGFWRTVPGLFVTFGLLLTFLGLISALSSMDLTAQDKIEKSLRELLTIASAKFIMSLTGLFCSIVFTLVLRRGVSQVERAIHDLCAAIEKRLTFISLEELAVEQLAAIREQREHFRLVGLELVAELGRPLREELPTAISTSISSAMAPIMQQISQAGADGMGEMVKGLSERFSDDVGRALAKASESLVQAGDRIAALSERMDQSSGRVGTEIDAAVARLTQAVEDLRSAMGATAQTASGAFTQGAEQLLAVMDQTLEGIRDNTGESARALSEEVSRGIGLELFE